MQRHVKTAAFWVLAIALLLSRVPSSTQPAGADQGLYAYVGQRILHGELPYRDAWDQKPPAIHYTYALIWAFWPDERAVAFADMLVAAGTALVIWRLGRLLGGSGAGEAAALLFLLLGNPALQRLGGVRIRAQCEVFIGLAVAAAMLTLFTGLRDLVKPRGTRVLVAGVLLGIAFLYKYNAGVYLVAALAALWFWSRPEDAPDALPSSGRSRNAGRLRLAWQLILGFVIPIAIAALVFAAGGALDDLYQATITYNLQYSGETYEGPFALVRYLITFPVRHASLDALWFLGGLGSIVLVLASWRRPAWLVVPIWVGAACLSIAINGSRGLPQYFLQAQPALALAVGLAGVIVWRQVGATSRLALAAALVVGVVRIANFDKVIDYTAHDLRFWGGRLSAEQYLARFGERASGEKYSALANRELAGWLRTHVPPGERALVFGFSPGALVQANRQSASRFFWSRPVIVGFNEGKPGYGVQGLLQELDRTCPAVVVLQRADWDPVDPESASFFMGRPELRSWLEARYEPAGELGNFVLWTRRPDWTRGLKPAGYGLWASPLRAFARTYACFVGCARR
jgi:Dolichyl-phosphate-mannose-protein mannosyltransferase